MEKIAYTLEEFEAVAARFVADIEPSHLGATLVTLSGELGAGKTTFTKAVAKTLGVTETVNSPTFVLEKIYQLQARPWTQKFRFMKLIHIDAYRLENGDELAPLGFDKIMKEPGNLILLEWPEKVQDALTKYPSIVITIEVLPENARKITKIRHD